MLEMLILMMTLKALGKNLLLKITYGSVSISLSMRNRYWVSSNLPDFDRRSRQIFPNRTNEVFGDLNILFFGDFFQLPLVGRKPLFSNSNGSADEVQGRRAYRSFDNYEAARGFERTAGLP
jgi:hypothetical protein